MNRIPAPLLPLTAALSWGAMFPIAHHAFPDVDPFNLTAIRYLTASAIFVALLAWIEGRGSLNLAGRGRELLLLGTFGFTGFSLLVYLGLDHTEPQNAAVLIATMPLVTVVIRWVRDGIRPARSTVGLIAVALVGVVLVVTHGDLGSFGGGYGDLLVLGGIVCWVLYTLGAPKFPEFSPLRYTALSASLGTIGIVMATGVADIAGWQHLPTGGDIGATVPEILYVILFGAVIAVVAWNAGVQRLGPANASLFITLVPVTAFAIRIGEGYTPGGAEIAGAGLVLAALLGTNLLTRRVPAGQDVANAGTNPRRNIQLGRPRLHQGLVSAGDEGR